MATFNDVKIIVRLQTTAFLSIVAGAIYRNSIKLEIQQFIAKYGSLEPYEAIGFNRRLYSVVGTFAFAAIVIQITLLIILTTREWLDRTVMIWAWVCWILASGAVLGLIFV